MIFYAVYYDLDIGLARLILGTIGTLSAIAYFLIPLYALVHSILNNEEKVWCLPIVITGVISSTSWVVYGYFLNDWFIFIANAFGVVTLLLQLLAMAIFEPTLLATGSTNTLNIPESSDEWQDNSSYLSTLIDSKKIKTKAGEITASAQSDTPTTPKSLEFFIPGPKPQKSQYTRDKEQCEKEHDTIRQLEDFYFGDSFSPQRDSKDAKIEKGGD